MSMSHTRECVYAIVEHSWIVVVYSERWNVQDMTVFPESKTSGNCMGEETKKTGTNLFLTVKSSEDNLLE